MGASKWFFSMSGLILLIGALAIAGKGINFGIDFESGTRITAPLKQAATVDEVRNALRSQGFGDAKIQTVNNPDARQARRAGLDRHAGAEGRGRGQQDAERQVRA